MQGLPATMKTKHSHLDHEEIMTHLRPEESHDSFSNHPAPHSYSGASLGQYSLCVYSCQFIKASAPARKSGRRPLESRPVPESTDAGQIAADERRHSGQGGQPDAG